MLKSLFLHRVLQSENTASFLLIAHERLLLKVQIIGTKAISMNISHLFNEK